MAAIYFAVRFVEFRKFLSGWFFLSFSIQIYFYLAKISIPYLGTSFVQTPEISLVRSIPYFLLFAATFYCGYVHKPKRASAG